MKRYAALAVTVAVLVSLALWQVLARATAVQSPGDDPARLAQLPTQAQQAAQAGLPNAPYLESLPAPARQKLAQEGFVIPEGAGWGRVARLYSSCKEENIPIFVTTDAMLHTSHQLFDWCLRFLEMGHLRSDLLNLTDAMLREMMARHDEAKAELPREAALLAASYFTVAKALLTADDPADIPEPYGSRIQEEIGLVRQAQGLGTSPVMGYREDYSQYRPRGHYSRSEVFEQYFRCLMWYGRMTFRVSPAALQQPGVTLDDNGIRRQALAGAMICSALRSARVKGESAEAVWRRIYETTAYFGGPSDDLTLLDCEQPLTAVYGARPAAAAFGDEARLADFMARVQKLRRPQILSTLALWRTEPGPEQQTHAISFMGQRFSVDGLILNRLVFDSVGEWRGGTQRPFTAVNANGLWIRGLPRGLDVMAALGSSAALKTLQADGDTAYQGYDERLSEVREAVDGLEQADWTRDLYMRWASALRALLEEVPEAAPAFCRGEAWPLKQLHAALGSWTELKHDTMLYTKQPYTMSQAVMAGVSKVGPAPPEPTLTRGYVEPVPEAFGRLAAAVEGLGERLTELGYPRDAALEGNFESYAGLLRKLEAVARKELAGQALSQEEYQLIWEIGDALSLYLAFPHHTDVSVQFMTRMDLEMPIVADVATDPNSGMVLEQAVGWPMIIYVLVPVEGTPTVCKGVVYSYYEFKQPMAERLTDEQWRELLARGKAPPPPQWTERFTPAEAGR